MEETVSERRKELKAMVFKESHSEVNSEDEIAFSENNLNMPKRAYSDKERKAAWDTWAE